MTALSTSAEINCFNTRKNE